MSARVIGGKYKVIERLGGGGMAVVYRGEHAFMKKPVAIKVLPKKLSEDPGFVKLFMREAETSAKLDHPNIVKVFDFGNDQGLLYLVMQYIPGITLDERIAKAGKISLREALRIFYQLLAALSYAHNRGVVHRDVKPSNVLLSHEGRAYLFDFGIAVLGAAARSKKSTVTPGTPEYMSPEQLRGRVDPRSDLYSAGVCLFEMLTGRVPFQDESLLGLQLKIMKEEPPRPSELSPEVPRELDEVVLRAMAKLPSERFQSAYEFAKAIEALHLVEPPPDLLLEPPGNRRARVEAPKEPKEEPQPELPQEAQDLDLSITQFVPVAEEEADQEAEEWEIAVRPRRRGLALFILIMMVVFGLGVIGGLVALVVALVR